MKEEERQIRLKICAVILHPTEDLPDQESLGNVISHLNYSRCQSYYLICYQSVANIWITEIKKHLTNEMQMIHWIDLAGYCNPFSSSRLYKILGKDFEKALLTSTACRSFSPLTNEIWENDYDIVGSPLFSKNSTDEIYVLIAGCGGIHTIRNVATFYLFYSCIERMSEWYRSSSLYSDDKYHNDNLEIEKDIETFSKTKKIYAVDYEKISDAYLLCYFANLVLPSFKHCPIELSYKFCFDQLPNVLYYGITHALPCARADSKGFEKFWDDKTLQINVASQFVIFVKNDDYLIAQHMSEMLMRLKWRSGIKIINKKFTAICDEGIDKITLVINPCSSDDINTQYICYLSADRMDIDTIDLEILLIKNPPKYIIVSDELVIPILRQKYNFPLRGIYYLPENIKGEEDELFWLRRFLFGIELISIKGFLDIKPCPPVEPRVVAGSKMVSFVLSLPETPERINIFREDNPSAEFVRITGVKHNVGWIGCAASYRMALEQFSMSNADLLEIVEDDCVLPNDWDCERQKLVRTLTSTRRVWDVYCGLVSDAGDKFKIIDIEIHDDVEVIFFQGMIGMVHNIYKKSVFYQVSKWLPDPADSYKFAIDRCLERNTELVCVTILPFTSKLAPEARSTLWSNAGKNIEIYTEVINRSESFIETKIMAFKLKKAMAL